MDIDKLKRNFLFSGRLLKRGSKINYLSGVIEATLLALIIPLVYEVIAFIIESEGPFQNNLFKMRHLFMTVLLFCAMNLRYVCLISRYNKELSRVID